MSGYYRSPTIHGETVVFVCEDDLWAAPVEGGIARRLTTSLGAASNPRFSPDGALLAFSGREEGPWEVYCMPALGGEVKRLTYQGAFANVVGWTPDDAEIVYASTAGQAFGRAVWLWRIDPEGGSPERLSYGIANQVSFGPSGGVVIGRHTGDPARWKRYRGGTAGRLWIDRQGSGAFRPLVPVEGNHTAPMWIGKRIYFISDHEGIGNVYSCLPSGKDLRRHTHHEEYYCRCASTDGQRIVYHAGDDLYVYDIEGDTSARVPVEFRSSRVQRQRKFVSPGRYLHEFALHPDGRALALTVRGKPFTMANWEGAVVQHGERDGVRDRLAHWLNDGERLVAISDADGEEVVEVHARDGLAAPVRLTDLDIGRPTGLAVSPKKDQFVLCNHRLELLLVDLETREFWLLDRSRYRGINGMAWSPDGRWVAYGLAATERTASIKVCKVETGETWQIAPPEFYDVGPAWDPEGKYLYFLSLREFNPVYDEVHFELSFPRAMRPLLVTLRNDLPNPFVPAPRPLHDEKKDDQGKAGSGAEEGAGKPKKKAEEEKLVEIDFEGIEQRVVAFPYPEGRYSQIAGIQGKALFTSFPIEGSIRPGSIFDGPEPKGVLHVYDFKEQKKDTIVQGISCFDLSRDAKTLVYQAKDRLRVIKAGEKPPEKNNKAEGGTNKDATSRQTGWIDLGRVKVSVAPLAEWRQMYREAWRLQREHFWPKDMSGVDWQRVYDRYLPLLGRVATRSEFSDLMWEMQGELGTSHCYEFGGDYRPSPHYAQGFLGADFACDPATGGYRITHIVRGDPWDEMKDSPFNEPGVNVREGDVLLAIGGQALSERRSPGALLVNLAKQAVELTVLDSATGQKRTVTVKALPNEDQLRYREWVSTNRAYVHKKTRGKVGYVHIPDMMGRGYAEFHRGWLAELDRPGLIVDGRYNGGGYGE